VDRYKQCFAWIQPWHKSEEQHVKIPQPIRKTAKLY